MSKKHDLKEIIFMDKYRLISDSMNIVLQEKKIITGERGKPLTKSKKGDIAWANIAYFSNHRNALHYIVDKEIKEILESDDLRKLVGVTDNLYKAICALTINLSQDNPEVKSSGIGK